MMNQIPNVRHWIRGDLKAYRDGELPAWRHRLAAWHIERCEVCRNEAAWLEQMSDQFAGWENDNSPLPRPELRARILACLPAETPLQLAQAERAPAPRTATRPAPRPVWALGSVTALLLLMGGGFALHHQNGLRQHTVSSLIAQADAKPMRVVSIFTAPENSYDSAAMLTTRTAVLPESASLPMTTTAANSRREKTVNAANVSASAPSDETYSDPTSREAERLASLKIGDMLNAKHQQMAANTKSAARPSQSSQPANRTAPPARPQIALAVADVSEARHQLQQWADISGGNMRVMADKRKVPAVFASNGVAIPAGTLLEMRVPAHFADSLQAHLNQIGRPLAVTSAKSKNQRALMLSEAGSAVAPSSVTSPLPTISSKSLSDNGDSTDKAMVTIRVRLLSAEPTAQP